MTPITCFTFERVNDDVVTLCLNGNQLNDNYVGRKIEAQFEVLGCYLVFLKADLTKVVAYLFNSEGGVIDEQVIGHWYFDAELENLKLVSQNAIEFDFGTRGRLEVQIPPKRPGLFKAKRYLSAQGLPIEV